MVMPVERGQFFCEMCGKPIEREDISGRCIVCGKVLCKQCGVNCATCGKILCRLHGKESKGVFYCEEHKPGCFIVTAVYGTSDMAHLSLFYNFRDNILLNSHRGGRKIVEIYYQISPSFANFLRKHEAIRNMTRYLIINPIYHILKLLTCSGRAS
ncbi:hypothetical protein KKF82_07370 [Patescibacteria group bacterium]|nr:hypothetical protein [Patescibacteria group bacterium]